jgi:aminomethyltransferase
VDALTAHFAGRGVCLATLPDGGAVPADFGDPAAEHRATREACGLFDFSFMGAWEILGRDARAHLARLQTRDLATLVPGRCAYTLLLRDDGSVVNDATVWKFSAERYWLFTGRPADGDWVVAGADALDVLVREREPSAVIALQGPASGAVLAKLVGSDTVRDLGYFRFAEREMPDGPCLVARLGYSGELGYEIVVEASRAVATWQALLAAGGAYGIREAGFSAADSLRIDCGHILFLRELARPRLPSELGLARLVTSTDPAMRGGEALRTRADVPHARLVGVVIPGAPAPADAPPMELTSEADSPTFGGRIGLGFAPAAHDRVGTVLREQDGRACVVTALSRYDPERLRPHGDPLP